MHHNFVNKLSEFKQRCHLSARELAKRAEVSEGLISGVLNGYRVVGEKTARKIGNVLELQGTKLEQFIYLALNTCSRRTLASSHKFPSEILNLVAAKLEAAGLLSENIQSYVYPTQGDMDAQLVFMDGTIATINVEVLCR